MFEHYLHHNAPDTRRRLRLAIAVNIAAFGTAGALAFTWLMGKLQIAQVTPPSSQFTLVQMSLDVPPPPAAPPAAPPARQEPETRADTPEEPDAPPEDFDEVLPPPRPRAAKVPSSATAPASSGASPFPGVPGVGIGPPGVSRLPPGIGAPGLPIARKDPEPARERQPVPFSAVKAQAIYTPDPSQSKLLATRTGMFNQVSGENETSFCIDAAGRTTEVRTVKPFPGDPGVDAVCRETVKTWRFKPFLVEGKAVKTCAVQVFRITFQ